MTSLQTDYEQAGFGAALGFGAAPAVILIDFVQAYFLETSPLYTAASAEAMRAALDAALRIRKAAHRAGVPVIITKVELSPREMEGHLVFRKSKGIKLFETGSPFAAFGAGLVPGEDDLVLSKMHASSFFGTPLASILVAHRVDSLIITGLSTSGCVRATCVDSVSFGFAPLVVRDAVADRDSYPHEANLFDMGQKYADLVTSDDVVQYLDRRRV